MTRKLQFKFISVFMIIMLLFTLLLAGAVYYQKRSQLEYDCMMYMLNINNLENRGGSEEIILQAYPPYFVLEIDNQTDTSQVVLGEYFLAEQGVTTDELISMLAGSLEETGLLEEYQLRYYNGIRTDEGHRVVFMDVTYITAELHKTRNEIILFAVPSLALMFVVALFLSRWFVRPAKQALDEQQRFVSFASHELKTPLSIISANMDLLDRTGGDEGPNAAFCYDNIRQECGRMQSLTEAMVWLALPGRSGQEEQLDVTKLLQEEALRFEVRAFEEGHALETEIGEGLSLHCDRVQLLTVVDVLLDNALKYCSPGGDIRLTARRCAPISRRAVQISVGNAGKEIPKSECENIFKPFYQMDLARKGAGIGLSIAREIVSALRGQIRVEYKDGMNWFLVEL
ncbi:MAG: HAMP domain-containing histidine kinase [Oscillospiraceae bacterium]|nr:HAMP domain-containing histidine kinase [Oscillospiraceae bacterium]